MSGKLYGVGVGPGEPSLITLKAIKCIQSVDAIAIPAKSADTCVVYDIAKRAMQEFGDDTFEGKSVIACPIPMSMDREKLDTAYAQIADQLDLLLAEGKYIAFLNLGDPTVYGTYMPIHQLIRAKGYAAEIISGVTSFCAVAAKCEVPLAARDEKLHIVPGMYRVDEDELASGNVVLMKSAGNIDKNSRQLCEMEKQGKIKAYAVSNCGMENEVVWQDFSTDNSASEYILGTIDKIGKQQDEEEKKSYFTTVIVKKEL